MLAQDVVRVACDLDEALVHFRLGAAENCSVLRREHERCAFTSETELLLVVTQKVSEIDI